MNRALTRTLCPNCLSYYRLRVDSRTRRDYEYTVSRNYSSDPNSWTQVFFKLNHKIANSEVVNSTKESLIVIHEWLPISWSIEIAVVTAAIRTLVTFPLSISQRKIMAKYESLTPEINQFSQRLKKEVDQAQYAYNLSPLKAKLIYNYRLKQEMRRLIIRDNCHPFKASIVIWLQIPIWVVMSHSIRSLVFMYSGPDAVSVTAFNQLATEGTLWFPDLTQTDPYCVLPFLTAAVNLLIVQLHANERLAKVAVKSRMHTIITNFGRALALIMIPIGLQMPSAVCLYWLMSSSIGLTHNLILRNKAFKTLVGIKTS